MRGAALLFDLLDLTISSSSDSSSMMDASAAFLVLDEVPLNAGFLNFSTF